MDSDLCFAMLVYGSLLFYRGSPSLLEVSMYIPLADGNSYACSLTR